MISTAKIRDNFSRVAHEYEQYADIQGLLAERLWEEIKKEEISPDKILDIGCGTGSLLAGLSRHFSHAKVTGLDISQAMAGITKAKGIKVITADAQELPFDGKIFDLVISNTAYQWIINLNSAFKEVHRVLKDKGIFIFNCFGRRTFEELRDYFKIEEDGLPAKEAVYSELIKSGFSDIKIKVETESKYFDNLSDILRWLKNIGGNRFYSRPAFLTPHKLKTANDFYAHKYRHNGQVYATFEVIWVKTKK